MVEFSIVGLVFGLALAFCADVVIKLSVKGKLDRMSFSAVSVIKERTQLFDETVFTISQAEFNQVNTIVQSSLNRTISNFSAQKYGSVLEVQTFNASQSAQPLQTFRGGGLNCELNNGALDPSLAVVTSWGRRTTLYRVTLCYETENWFGDIIGEDYRIVSSSSVMVGR
ncbi:tight adherence pilus pseudopilin TadF [Marinomonas fungiae]|uniref:tight adherence pilus pseudopilin TadF n=1 Tax=Marinomonas fungiae TaxID=1137284 RepID=UPI003A914875